jgi:hypothetical protein
MEFIKDLPQDTLRNYSVQFNSVDIHNVKAQQHKCQTEIQYKNNINTKKETKKGYKHSDSKKTAISIKYWKKKTKP